METPPGRQSEVSYGLGIQKVQEKNKEEDKNENR